MAAVVAAECAEPKLAAGETTVVAAEAVAVVVTAVAVEAAAAATKGAASPFPTEATERTAEAAGEHFDDGYLAETGATPGHQENL